MTSSTSERRARWGVLLPAVAVIAGILVLEVAWGANLGEALLYLCYELCFVVGPGWIAYRALSRNPGGALRQLALGWALGYVLEILAFMATAATGTRFLFALYPLVVLLIAGGVELRRRGGLPRSWSPRRGRLCFAWLVAAACLLIATYIAITYFASAPLPGDRTVSYFQDLPFALSLAGEAKHHWPITDPSVSGEPLPYHYFVHIHMAAVSQVTGINLPIVVFRLFILPLIVLVVVGLVAAGKSLMRSAGVGLLGACVVFLISQFNIDHSALFASADFLGYSFVLMFTSPSYLLGVALFVPLVMLLGERLADGEGRGSAGEWTLIGLLMVGVSDAKVAVLPLVIASLALYGGWRWLRDRRPPFSALIGAALACTVALAVYAWQYAGHSSGIEPDLIGGVHFSEGMFAVESIRQDLLGWLPSFPGKEAIISTGGLMFGMLGFLGAQLVGLIWFFRYAGLRLGKAQQWLLSILVAGFLGILFLEAPNTDDQVYFLVYALIPGSLLPAQGLIWAWQRRPAFSGQGRTLAGLGLACALVVAALMAGPAIWDPFTGSLRSSHTFLFVYGAFLLLIVLLAFAARRRLERWRWAAAALSTTAILAVGLLDSPLGYVLPAVRNSVVLVPNRKLTPDLYQAMAWIRDNTRGRDVIAVNSDESLAFEYAGFAERTVFLGGSAYSTRIRERAYRPLGGGFFLGTAGGGGGELYPARRALNLAAFQRADASALGEMEDHYKVRYLLIDRVNGYPSALRALAEDGRIVYRNGDAIVIRL